MKKLITGGTGLIGSAFKDGVKIGSNDYNLIDSKQVEQMFIDHKPNVVVHTAAMVGGVGANMTYPADFFYNNIMMNTNVIEQSRLANV
jgi:GDP-L-fucose synthase